MFSGKTILVGIAAVIALYVGMWLFKGFSQISGGRTSGPAVLVSNFVGVLTSPAFWSVAVVVFFGVVFLTAKLPAWRHS